MKQESGPVKGAVTPLGAVPKDWAFQELQKDLCHFPAIEDDTSLAKKEP